MIIAMDAMGGDNAPLAVVDGAIEALKENDIKIILVGDENAIKKHLGGKNYDDTKLEVIHASEIISNNEHPAMAIKKKKDSSLVRALNLVKEGKADAVISAGSTGAFLTGATLIIGRIKGIKRPALAPIMPGKNNSFMVIDVGGNVDCKAEYLEQFAIMGKVYFENVMNIKSPKVGLVNIGEEEEKGNELTKATYPLLKNNKELKFVGNIEPRDIARGDVEVIVCDGFVGNTILKMYEGVTKNVFDILKEEIYKSTRSKIGGLILKPVFKSINKRYDYKEIGGSPFLGTKGVCIKAHGSSDARAFRNAVKQAVKVHENKVVEKISIGVSL